MLMTITQFRRDLFSAVDQAMNGVEVRVMHKGKGFTLKPDDPPKDRLSRLTPMRVILGDIEEGQAQLMKEMEAEWKQDWSEL